MAFIIQKGIPPEKASQFAQLAQSFIANNICTPAALASALDSIFTKGEARPYAQALWDAFGLVDPSLRRTHDWNDIFSDHAAEDEVEIALRELLQEWEKWDIEYAAKGAESPEKPPTSHPLPIVISGGRVRIGRHSQVSFVRTLRVPEDGKAYPLPAGMGRLPLYRVEDYAHKVPAKWLKEGGFFIPLYQREALYLEFEGVKWRPAILKVAVGRVNAINGRPLDSELRKQSQDYVVIPDQQWLDGINKGNGVVSQFVAMPLGQGYTIEEQVTDEAEHGGVQLVAYDPKADHFAEEHPDARERALVDYDRRHPAIRLFAPPLLASAPAPLAKGTTLAMARTSIEMGLAAGGSIGQKVVADPHGIDSWDSATATSICIHIVNSDAFEEITGEKPPPTPITAYSYKKRGLPWFSKYEESTPGLPGAKAFRFIKNILQIDQICGVAKKDEVMKVEVSPELIQRIHIPTLDERIMDLRNSIGSAFQTSRFENCIRNSTALLDLIPNDAHALLMRARSYMHVGMHKLADMDASMIIAADPRNVHAYLLRAEANITSGWPSLAVVDAKAVLAIEPTNANARKILKEAETAEAKKRRRD